MIQRRNFGSSPTSTTPQPRARKRGPSGVASVRYLPSGLFTQLEAPWNKPFQEEMKKSIPAKKRMWDNNDKCWYIVRDQFDKLTHLLDKHYDETILLDFPAADVSPETGAKLFLLEGAPIELVQAAYRIMAKKHHPDIGGDPLKMVEINAAYKELMGEFSNGKSD